MRANIVGCQLYLSQYQCINSNSLFQLLTFSEYNVNIMIVVEVDFAVNSLRIVPSGDIQKCSHTEHAYHFDIIQGVSTLEQLLVQFLQQFCCIL